MKHHCPSQRSEIVWLLAATTMFMLVAGVAKSSDEDEWWRFPYLVIPKIEQPPKIDGEVSESEWRHAARLTPLVERSEGIADERVRAIYAAYDEENLYLAWRIERPEGSEQPEDHGGGERVDRMVGDFVEIMIDSNKNASNYYQFIVFGKGSHRDGIGSPQVDSTHNMEWESAVAETTDGWQGEVAIPFASLGLDRMPEPGTVMGFDFVDNQRTPQRYVGTWSFRGDYWHALGNFGHLVFGGADIPVVRFIGAGEVGGGKILTEFEVLNPGGESVDLDASVRLYKRHEGSEGGDRSYYPEVESGMDRDYDAGGRDFYTGQTLDNLARQTLASSYGQVAETVLEESMKPGGRQVVSILHDGGAGEYVVEYGFVDKDKDRALARGVAVFEVSPPIRLGVRPLWLYSKLLEVECAITGLGFQGEGSVLFELTGGEDAPDSIIATEEVSFGAGENTVATVLSTAATTPGGYFLRATVKDENGKPLGVQKHALVKPEPPPWFGNDHGLRVEVPRPWTPVKASPEGEVEIWGRTYRFDGLFPSSIVSQGAPVLAAPVQITLVVEGEPLSWEATDFRLQEASDGKVVYSGVLENELFRISGTVAVEFDGFAWYDLELEPKAPVHIDEGRIDIPVHPAIAKLQDGHRFLQDPVLSSEQIGITKGGSPVLEHTLMGFSPYRWIGDEQAGIAFVGERMKNWSITKPGEVIELLPPGMEDEAAHMRIRFIDHPIEMSKPLALEFGLQAYPIRELPEERTVHVWQTAGTPAPDEEFWQAAQTMGMETAQRFHWQGKPNAGWPFTLGGEVYEKYYKDAVQTTLNEPPEATAERHEQMKAGIAMGHEHGIKSAGYTGWGVHRAFPEWRDYGYEFIRLPVENSGFGSYRQSAGLNGGYVDFMAWMHAHLAKEYQFDGVHWDSTGNLLQCMNHRIGNGWVDEEGRERPGFSVRATRDLFRRIYTIYHEEERPEARINNGGGGIWAINVFGTTFHRGEGTPMHVEKLVDAWSPIEDYRTSYWARPFGLNFLGMNKNNRNLPMTVSRHSAVFLLHGDMYKPVGWVGVIRGRDTGYGHDDYPEREIWAARNWLPLDSETRRLHYFEDQQAAVPEDADLLASVFVSGKSPRALVVVANLDDREISGVRVRLDAETMGLQGALKVEDAILGEAVPVDDGGVVTLDIEPERYRLLKVEAE